MFRFLFGFVTGIVVTCCAVWYLGARPVNARAPVDGKPAVQTQESGKQLTDSLKLSADDIKEEMRRAGKVIRSKINEGAQKVAHSAGDVGITTAIKAKYVADPDVSAMSVSVNTTAGIVTLSGTASSPDNIRKAIQLAYETEGVNQVVSTIQVKE